MTNRKKFKWIKFGATVNEEKMNREYKRVSGKNRMAYLSDKVEEYRV